MNERMQECRNAGMQTMQKIDVLNVEEMKKIFLNDQILPIAYCLLPIAYCLS